MAQSPPHHAWVGRPQVSLSPLLGCSDGGGDSGMLPDHPRSLRCMDPGKAQQACLGDLLDADNVSKPLLLLVPLPGFCSHTHFPPTFASHFTWSVELSFSSPDSAFVIVPTLQFLLLLIAILTLRRRERPLVQKLVAEFLCGCLFSQHGAKNPPIPAYTCCSSHQEGHLLPLPLRLGWSWNLFLPTK